MSHQTIKLSVIWVVFFSSGCLFTTLKAATCEDPGQQLLYSMHRLFHLTTETHSSFKHASDLLVTSLTSVLHRQTLTLWGWPHLGRFDAVMYHFQFLLNDLSVIWEIFIVLGIFLHSLPVWYFSVSLPWSVLNVLLSSWCSFSQESFARRKSLTSCLSFYSRYSKCI